MHAALSETRRSSGLRRVNLERDLRAIAALIEEAFRDEMDAGGRATISELRGLSRLGPLLRVAALADRMLRGIGQGFVWEQDGQIVGNVTLIPADYPPELGRTIIIANVAVAPAYRRQGIARQLMLAALESIRAGGATAAILEVDAANTAAWRLYDGLGFRTLRTWHAWRRGSDAPLPPRLPDSPPITRRPEGLWRAEYAMAARAFPPELGGLGWQRPLHPREFHRSLAGRLGDFLTGSATERWISRDGERVRGSLWARMPFASGVIQLTLIVPPEEKGHLEEPLLNYGVRQLAPMERALSCEHPADDEHATEALRRYGFSIRRTLTHMRLDF